MIRVVLACVISVWWLLPLQAGPPLDEAAADALVRESLRAWNVPGAAIAVVDRNGSLYQKGFGVRAAAGHDPVTVDTLFPLASCSKALTATLIGKLVDEGLMSWDEPVRTHWPGFRLQDPLANQGVAIRDLLCHRTGLAHHDELWYGSDWPLEEVIRRSGALPPSRPFRTAFQYQSVMVAAAGLAAARAGGRPWDELMRDRLLQPLGMNQTTCVQPANGELAQPHKPDEAGMPRACPRYELRSPNPAGSLHSTARDLAAWLTFQLGDGTVRGRRVIAQATLAETHTPQMVQRMNEWSAALHPDTAQMSYGLGWVIQDYRGVLIWSHAGWIDGFSTYIVLAPRAGYGVAVVSNLDRTRMNHALCNTVLDRLLGLDPRDWNTYLRRVVARQNEVDAAERTRRKQLAADAKFTRPIGEYAGTYTHPAYGDMVIQEVAGRLRWEWRGRPRELRHLGHDRFDCDWPGLGVLDLTFTATGRRVEALEAFAVKLSRK